MMKTTRLLKSMLLLCALIVGSGSVWADEISLTASSGFVSSYSSDRTITVSGKDFKESGIRYNGNNSPSGFASKQLIQMRTSGSGAGQIYNTTAINTITSVEVTLVNNNNAFTIYYGTAENPSTNSIASSSITPVGVSFPYTDLDNASASATAYKFTFDLSSYKPTYIKIVNGVSANYVGSIVINSTEKTWDLSTDSYDATPTTNLISWTCDNVIMQNEKGTGTNVNNYIPTTQSSTRFYTNNILTITPTTGYTINSVVFTATTDGYATALKNSKWTNATAAASGQVVTVTPMIGIDNISAIIGALCGFTEVRVSYAANPSGVVPITPAKEYTTLKCAYDLDFSSVSGAIKAYVAASTASGGVITFTGKDAVPAGTPLLIKTTTPGATVNVPVAASTPGSVGTNYLVAGDGSNVTYDAGASHFYYILTNGQFKAANNSPVAVGKAYLSLPSAASANELTVNFEDGDGDVTGIKNLTPALSQGEGVAYNLAGQRVNASHKGLVIVNGKKYLNK